MEQPQARSLGWYVGGTDTIQVKEFSYTLVSSSVKW